MKYGVFTDFSLQQFLFIVAGLGAVIYFLCAFFFQKKGQSKGDEKSIAKGILVKRIVQLYALVQAAYLAIIFLLLITFQLNSYWGSRLLIITIAFNVFVPIISFSLLGPDALKKVLGKPSG